MLFNPKWDKGSPSVAGFRAWLQRQPPGRQFPYYRCNECAVGQYLIACGTYWDEQSAKDGKLLAALNLPAYRAAKESHCRDITAPMVLRKMGE